jgi:apolipoprotein N-acyltransferase
MPAPSSTGFDLFVPALRSARLLPTVLAMLAGSLLAASLTWPMAMPQALVSIGLMQGQPVWWAALLALAVLVCLLQQSSSKRVAAWRGWWFATTWLACTFGWLFISMHTYGGLAAPLAILAVLVLSGVLAIYYAAACGLFWSLSPVQPAFSALLFAALWLLAELARGLIFTGFGWGAIGYTQIDGPLAIWLAWLGLYGVTALSAALAALLAAALRASSWTARLTAILIAALVLLAGQGLPQQQGQSAGSLSVTLLQGNIAQEEKFAPNTGIPKALHWYGEQLQANTSALIITPETALALLPEQLPGGYWKAIQQRFASGKQAALVGLPLGSYDEGYTNSVLGFKPDQAAPWRYDKHHLVPFGEFIPPFFRWFTNLMAIPLGDFNRGALPQPTFDWQGQRLAATICYENLFSEELAAQFADSAKAPTILVNISNLGWFGDSLAMNQHLQIARLRALEFDRPFLLATNTGQTAIVDHRGVVTHAAQSHTAVALQGQVQGRIGITPYAYWVTHFGLWPLVLLALAVLATIRLRQ